MPLAKLIRDTAHAVVEALGLEQKDVVVEGLATRWQRGTLVMQPADSSLQAKEVPLETFFHKIVMIRNNLHRLNFIEVSKIISRSHCSRLLAAKS